MIKIMSLALLFGVSFSLYIFFLIDDGNDFHD